jgi:RimJ/RimL family protein N-acetyltransferase
MTLLESRSGAILQDPSRPVLQTERLTLRAPCLADAAVVAGLANDRRIAENTAQIPHPYRLSDAESFIGSANSKADANFLVALADATLIGVCGIAMRGEPAPELGYWLGLAYWGHGFATEAVRAVIDYAFGDLKLESIQAGARVTNPASRRVLEKCGFQWTGVGLYRIRALASSAPIDRFRLERGIWASLKNWGPMRRVA